MQENADMMSMVSQFKQLDQAQQKKLLEVLILAQSKREPQPIDTSLQPSSPEQVNLQVLTSAEMQRRRYAQDEGHNAQNLGATPSQVQIHNQYDGKQIGKKA